MKIREFIPGLAVVLMIGLLSTLISTFHASFDALVISIIIAMFLGNIIGVRDVFRKGIEAAMKVFLPAGIALYGTQLVFRGLNFWLIIAIFLVFLCLFGFTMVAANVFNVNRKTSILLASGLAICGATAIAVISPLIKARREDTSISIISVMMLGLTGMIFFPMVYDAFSLTPEEFNFLSGTTLPMLGQVKVAAANVCPDCTTSAVDIKLVRISFLLFVVTVAVVLSGGEERRVRVPWFVIAFVVLAVLSNAVGAIGAAYYLKDISSFLLSVGLAGIGFSVEFDSIIEEGITPLGVIFVSWIITILIIYLVRNLT